jgi:hypothetical protein
MKCKYGDIWLTGTPWQEGAGAVEWTAEQLVDVVSLIGANTPKISGRGNVADRVPVPLVRNFNTPEDALQFIAELPWQLPKDGELRFEEGTLVVVFPKAAFTGLKRRRTGVSVDVVCEFTVSGPPTINPE